MSDSKTNAATDEIDQIMSEIEELQQEMAGGEPAQPASLRVIEGGANGAPAEDAPPAEDLMAEFAAGNNGGEASLEGTLSELGDGGPATGNSLLDQMDSAEAETPTDAEADLSTIESEVEAAAQQAQAMIQSTVDEVMETSVDQLPEKETEVSVADFRAAAAEVEAEMKEQLEETPMAKKPAHSTDSGTMEMTLQGTTSLRIRYQFDGQEVVVGFHDQALHVQLSDGTEFKIPVSRRTGLREAA